jgi:predicted nucleic acid-binding protein
MPSAGEHLLDTNVLLRRVQPSHPSRAFAVDSVARLLDAGEAVHFTLQNIAEFWNVATRPAEHNGLGSPAAVALVEVEKVEAAFDLLPDTPFDAAPSFIYKSPMICAFPRLMATTNSLGFAGGPEGMRVR